MSNNPNAVHHHEELEKTAIPYLFEMHQRRVDKVFESDLAVRSTGGVQYGASVLVAEYLGIRVIGRVSPWIRRLKYQPEAVPPNLREGVARLLGYKQLELSEGQVRPKSPAPQEQQS